MSEHGREENWTPNKGPPGRLLTPGGKCSWMMKLAVRVVNALPRVLNKAAVPAFEIAASLAGTSVPSKPVATNPVIGFGVSVGPGPPPRNCVAAGAPVIVKRPSTLPSLSVTATVTARLSAEAADTACAITVCTSLVVSEPAVADGGGGCV